MADKTIGGSATSTSTPLTTTSSVDPANDYIPLYSNAASDARAATPASIAAGLTNVVHTTGNETVGGTKTFSSSPIISQINDSNGNTMLVFSTVASAVNYLQAVNAATGGNVVLQALGTDTNIPVIVKSKGTGIVKLVPGSDSTQAVMIRNSADNGASLVADSVNSRVGIGQSSAPTARLYVNGSIGSAVTAKNSAYTATASDSMINVDATSGAVTITLPTAVGISGTVWTVRKKDSSANAVTIATTSSQTINASTTKVLSSQYNSCTVQSDGSNWMILANV